MVSHSKVFFQILAELESYASAERQAMNMRFFKTEKGQYGYGDQFMGVRVPDQRKVAKKFKDVSLGVVKEMLYSPVHEVRLCGLFILVGKYERAVSKDDVDLCKELKDFYLNHKLRVNNWDLVDSSAHKILGAWLRDYGSVGDRKVLFDLIQSSVMWDRRIAVVSCFAFIAHEDFDDAMLIASKLLTDSEDLMHKAVGWMLREVGKKDARVLRTFLEEHCLDMPRTMLRYSIEKFPENERKMWLNKGK